MKNIRAIRTALGVSVLAGALVFSSESAEALEWNGFGSGYLQQNTSGNLVEPQSRAGLNGRQYGVVGLNLRSQIDEEFSFAGQFVATGFGLSGLDPFVITADWGFLSYKPTSDFEVRIGRQLFPASVVAEYQDVGALLPFTRTPMTYFRTAPFKSFDGLSADYKFGLFGGKLGVKVMAGSATTPLNGETLTFTEVKNGTLYYEESGLLIRGTISNFQIQRTNAAGALSFENDDVTLYTIGAKYDRNDLVAILEYRQRSSDQRGTNVSNAAAVYNQLTVGTLATLGYRFGKFLPAYTYSYGDFRALGTASVAGVNQQHTATLGYQASSSVVVKAEYTQVGSRDGAAGGVLDADPTLRGLSDGQFFLVGADFLF